MAIASRLNRLETALANGDDPGQTLFDAAMADFAALGAWLEERAYPDALAAVDAGATAPEGLQELLAVYAVHDAKHRAWARIEAALDAGELPADADLGVHCGAG